MLRLKMQVTNVLKNAAGVPEGEQVSLCAVGADSDENKVWSKFTPLANLHYSVTNPNALGQLAIGDVVYVTLDKVAPATTVTAGGMTGLPTSLPGAGE